MDPATQVVEQHLLTVARAVEDQLDDQLQKLENLDEDDLERLRDGRLRQLKQQAARRQQWLAQGHGQYTEILSEKEFFSAVKASERVVCHFFRENWPCKVLDRHLDIIAKDHLETRFIKIYAEKSPFVTERLKIFMLPTLALICNGKIGDYVVGFDELGGKDDFTTQVLEARLMRSKVLFDEDDNISRSHGRSKAPPKNLRPGVSTDSDEDS